VNQLEKKFPQMPNKDQVKSWYHDWLKSVKEVFDDFDLVWVA